MWLDRFSGLSTPTESPGPHNRAHSPIPRRASHLAPGQRSGLGLTAGSSSLSLTLSSNDSNVSLATPVRVPNGSSLKHEQRASPLVTDPLKILRSVLGTFPTYEGPGEALRSHEEDGKPESLSSNIDFGDQSLEEYAKGGEEPNESLSVPVAQQAGFIDEREKYSNLHDTIKGCDEALRSIESYLASFEKELGTVSCEIQSLQMRSSQLTAKLENRKKVEKLVGPAVEEISISPTTVRTISERAIDEKWIEALNEIESRSAAMEKNDLITVKAIEDVKPLLEDLRVKASERIRDFMVAQIKALRTPDTNAQIIQHQKFIKYKDLYSFLAKNNSALADQIGQAYINTMKWYYSSNFNRYHQALEKLPLHIIDQTEVLGGDTTSGRRNKNSAPQHDAFILGGRADILRTKPATAISAYSAEADKNHHYLEKPFYSFNLALIDNVCTEFSVAAELFSSSKNSFQEVTRKVMEIFEPTFSLGHSFTKHLIETNNSNSDCLGILLCVRINQYLAFELQRRKVPIADSYINGTNMLLWPRFQILMDSHCESLRNFPIPSSSSSSSSFSTASAVAASLSLGGSSSTNTTNNPSTNAKTATTTTTTKPTSTMTSVAPHPLTQKFGHFLHALLSLSPEAADADEPVSHSLARLRSEYETVMVRLAGAAAAGAAASLSSSSSTSTATNTSTTTTTTTTTKKKQYNRFLYYNYSLVLTIVADVQGKLAGEVRARFEELIGETGAG